MGTLDTHGFDKCQPPVCSEDIDITVSSMICTEDQVLHIEWTVADRYDRDFGLNIIQWSSDNKNFDNIANLENATQPYKTSFDMSSCVGVVYLRVKIRIGTSFVYGEEESFSVNICSSDTETAVRASWYGDCPDTATTPPSYMLYARTSTISSYPIFFSYGGLCWSVNNNDSEIPVSDLPVSSILTDIDVTYDSGSNCCIQKDCPSSWVDIGDGDRIGTFYFEYQTYTIKDRLYVIKNWEATDCDLVLPPAEKIIFDTGCVGTNNESCPLFFVSSRKCLSLSYATYGFCSQVRESELPIGIIIDCNCALTSGTYWRICAIDPDEVTLSWEGSDECLCDSVEGSWFCDTTDNTCAWRDETGGYATQAECEAAGCCWCNGICQDCPCPIIPPPPTEDEESYGDGLVWIE